MDQVDRRIIGCLQKDARISNAEIARHIGMAPSATYERLRKLEERGIISGYRVQLNQEAMGFGLLAFVFVKTQEAWSTRETAERLAAIPNILECHDVAGDDCYLLKVRAKDTKDLNNLLRDHLGAIPTVVSTKTTIVFETFKEMLQMPIEEVSHD